MSSDTRAPTPSVPSRQLDQVFGVLSAELRRQALSNLAAADGPVPRSELAAASASEGYRESDRTQSDETAAALHHLHLPKLAAVGLVEEDSRGVRLTPLGERVVADLPERLLVGPRPRDG